MAIPGGAVQVHVTFFGPLQEVMRFSDLAVELGGDATVGDLLAFLAELRGSDWARAVRREDGQLRATVAFLVNGHNVFLAAGLDTILAEGDRVRVLPVIGGG